MVNATSYRLGVALGAIALLLAACSREQPGQPAGNAVAPGGGGGSGGVPISEAALKIDTAAYRVTGPFAHGDLCVFLIHSDQPDNRNFLTLDEGLKEDLVAVTEKEQEQVHELYVENRSDVPLFLQEGDRLVGGKQDRIIYTSLIVPPRTKLAVPTFCVEAGRWVAGAQGKNFGQSSNSAYAPKAVREAAKYYNNQSTVWANVASVKGSSNNLLASPNTNSSLTETLDSAPVKKLSDDAVAALGGVVEGSPNAVGVALAVGGKIQEVDIYPGHRLLQKVYPRLLQAYAVDAALAKAAAPATQPATTQPALAAADVVRYLQSGREKSRQQQALPAENNFARLELEDGKWQGVNTYKGTVTHLQVMSRSLNAPVAPNGAPPNSNSLPMPNVAPQQVPSLNDLAPNPPATAPGR